MKNGKFEGINPELMQEVQIRGYYYNLGKVMVAFSRIIAMEHRKTLTNTRNILEVKICSA